MICFPWSLHSHTKFLWCGEKWTSNTKCLLQLIKRRSKVQEKNILCKCASIFDQWKTFPKTIGQWDFDFGLFSNLPRIIVIMSFLQIHSNSKEVSYLSWENTYPNLKTTCHIKLKFFLWTKPLENLLLSLRL